MRLHDLALPERSVDEGAQVVQHTGPHEMRLPIIAHPRLEGSKDRPLHSLATFGIAYNNNAIPPFPLLHTCVLEDSIIISTFGCSGLLHH